MFELNVEIAHAEVAADQLTELAELQLALVGGGVGTPALE